MNEKKQAKFQDIYEKFVRKCLQEDIYPVVALRYEQIGVFPELTFIEVNEQQKKEALSSLNKKK
jgi:hypothetical protein